MVKPSTVRRILEVYDKARTTTEAMSADAAWRFVVNEMAGVREELGASHGAVVVGILSRLNKDVGHE